MLTGRIMGRISKERRLNMGTYQSVDSWMGMRFRCSIFGAYFRCRIYVNYDIITTWHAYMILHENGDDMVEGMWTV